MIAASLYVTALSVIVGVGVGLMTAILWLILLVLFTYFPPKLALFKDGVTGSYGIN